MVCRTSLPPLVHPSSRPPLALPPIDIHPLLLNLPRDDSRLGQHQILLKEPRQSTPADLRFQAFPAFGVGDDLWWCPRHGALAPRGESRGAGDGDRRGASVAAGMSSGVCSVAHFAWFGLLVFG
jgi:hypothetical protein